MYKWNQFCMKLDNGSLFIALNHEQKQLSDYYSYENKIKGAYMEEILGIEASNTIIGSQDFKQTSFIGDFADLNVWSYSIEDLLPLTKCLLNSFMSGGNYFNWSKAQMTIKGLQVREEGESLLCKDFRPFVYEFPASNYKTVNLFCQQFGSFLHYALENNEPFDGLYWAGYTDHLNEKEFIDSLGNPINNSLWKKGHPIKDVYQNCAAIDGNTLNTVVLDCEYELKAKCWFPEPPTIKLRGMGGDLSSIVDHTYNLNYITGYFEGSLMNTFLKLKDGSWDIQDKRDNKVLLNHTTPMPFGISNWVKPEYPTENIKLSFDVCREDQFNCDNGLCIDIQKRCDDEIDCIDESDENDCSLVKLPKYYNKDSVPLPVPNSYDFKKYFLLTISKLQVAIVEIVDSASIIKLQLGVFSTWRDSSLQFLNLNRSKEVTITKKEYEKIWTPHYTIYMVSGQEEDLGSKNVEAITTSEPKTSGIHEIRNSLVYQGDFVNMVSRNWYTTTIICTFDKLKYFPFDTNTCEFQIYLDGTPAAWSNPMKDVRLVSTGIVEFGPEMLGLYTISSMKTKVTANTAKLEVTMVFRRQFLGIFLQYCMPNILLLTVVYSSNLYYQEMTELAITINVTILLAMSNLFGTVFNAMPNTTDVKFMDLYQIKCLLIAILIIIAQTMFLYLRKEANGNKTLSKQRNGGKGCKMNLFNISR